MYDKLLITNQNNKNDILYLIGLHCTKSKKFQNQMLTEYQNKKNNIIETIYKLSYEDINNK
jgi:coenzyme F420-reducing hydrogenase beta subunit